MELPRRQIKNYLTASGPATLETVVSNTGIRGPRVQRILTAMVTNGKVSKVGDDYDMV